MRVDGVDGRCAAVGEKVKDFQCHTGLFRLYGARYYGLYDCGIDYVSYGVAYCIGSAHGGLLRDFVRFCMSRFLRGDFGTFYATGEMPVFLHEYGLYLCPFGDVLLSRNCSAVTVCFMYER